MLQILVPGVLIAIVGLAVRWDLLERRIPNALCAPALLAGLVLNVLSNGTGGLWFSLSGALTGLAVFVPFYLRRGMGAGDVKLMAAVGSFLGPLGALLAAATTLMLGAVIAIGLLVHRRFASRRSRLDDALPDGAEPVQHAATSLRQQRFPYAVAIAGGTVLFMWHQGQLDPLATALMG